MIVNLPVHAAAPDLYEVVVAAAHELIGARQFGAAETNRGAVTAVLDLAFLAALKAENLTLLLIIYLALEAANLDRAQIVHFVQPHFKARKATGSHVWAVILQECQTKRRGMLRDSCT